MFQRTDGIILALAATLAIIGSIMWFDMQKRAIQLQKVERAATVTGSHECGTVCEWEDN